jgi:Spy/CpxP family protein refolding chaperone
MVALAGGAYVTSGRVSAQGPTAGPGQGHFGGPGRMGGPGGPDGRRGGPGGLGDLMLRRLNLTDSQNDQVKQILNSHKDEQQALNDRREKAHEALAAAMTADPVDEGNVRARANELGDIEADAAVASAHVRNEILQILTADQRSQLKTLQAEMKQRRADMEKRRER